MKIRFFFAPSREIFRVLVAAGRARFCAIRNTFACEITELEEAVIGEKERTAKMSGLTLRAPATSKEATMAENSLPLDSITLELMSRIEQSRIDGIVIEFS